VREFTFAFPVQVITRLMGLPREHYVRYLRVPVVDLASGGGDDLSGVGELVGGDADGAVAAGDGAGRPGDAAGGGVATDGDNWLAGGGVGGGGCGAELHCTRRAPTKVRVATRQTPTGDERLPVDLI
jgi:hypothetical protein